MSAARWKFVALLLVAVAVVFPAAASAQLENVQLGGKYLETRANLEEQLKRAEASHQPTHAALIRARLRDGDFQEGDRIFLAFDTGPGGVVAETLSVRANARLEIPHYDALSLRGVLHSELEQKASEYMQNFFKNPSVRVSPLLRLSVQGAVARPGSYYTAPDAPLSDVIQIAGGQLPDADYKKTVVNRLGSGIWKSDDLQQAVAAGYSVDRLQLRSGDEVYVPRKTTINWVTWIQLGLSILTVALALTR